MMRMKRLVNLIGQFIPEILLLSLAFLALLCFIGIWLDPAHWIYIGEPNLTILTVETIFILFALGWGCKAIYRKIKQLREG